MKARVIAQINSTGEKHVTVTQDWNASLEDMTVTAPGWEDSVIIQSTIEINGDASLLGMLFDEELHSAFTMHDTITARIHPAIIRQLEATDAPI